jgi:uncharacterized C2H2 Zn-finger protein
VVDCPVCGSLSESDYAFSKYGWPAHDIALEPAASSLITIAGSRGGGRGEELQQCPGCGRFFHWKQSYEFLVNGSRDEETLTRIDAAAAQELRARLS